MTNLDDCLDKIPAIILPSESGQMYHFVQLYAGKQVKMPFLRFLLGPIGEMGAPLLLEKTLKELNLDPGNLWQIPEYTNWWPGEKGESYSVVGAGNAYYFRVLENGLTTFKHKLVISFNNEVDFKSEFNLEHWKKLAYYRGGEVINDTAIEIMPDLELVKAGNDKK